MSWMKQAIHQVNKPKESIIGMLKKTLGGQQPGRDRSVLHASDITKVDFCPRREAFYDKMAKKSGSQYVSTALDVTFRMGLAVESLIIEEWAGEHAVGNWKCMRCNDQRTMVKKPNGFCPDGAHHLWKYRQLVVRDEDSDVEGAIDCLFDVGTPKLMVTELKILNAEDFDKILVPLPEHRLRTNLYMKLIAGWANAYKERINVFQAKVLYTSRGYGRMNATWSEILPFKEYDVVRDDDSLKPQLQKAKALKIFRETGQMPSGICATAMDKIAQNCSVCKECFSGQFPAQAKWESL